MILSSLTAHVFSCNQRFHTCLILLCSLEYFQSTGWSLVLSSVDLHGVA